VIQSLLPDRKSGYAPEKEPCVAWPAFRARYPSFTAEWMPKKASELAESWTVAPG
jgi:hypothetical protein